MAREPTFYGGSSDLVTVTGDNGLLGRGIFFKQRSIVVVRPILCYVSPVDNKNPGYVRMVKLCDSAPNQRLQSGLAKAELRAMVILFMRSGLQDVECSEKHPTRPFGRIIRSCLSSLRLCWYR